VTKTLTIGLIRASLPRYFPDRHNVWACCEAALEALCSETGARLFVVPEIPQNSADTERALALCQAEGVDFVLLLHGGFTMGDISRTVAASPFRAGFWSVPEPVLSGDVQLISFVSLNMSMSIARRVRDLRRDPVQWYHGAPESPVLQARLRTTLRALAVVKGLNGARVGVVGGLAMTFFNMEVSTNDLRRRLGIEVAHHDIHELTGRMAQIPADRVSAELALMAAAAKIDGVSAPQMDLTVRCALALRDIATTGGYSALAVSDWPALQDSPGMHPGAALSWIEETDRIPMASEGDVLGAVTQLVSRLLTGKVGYLLDLSEPDLDAGSALVWHGGGGPLYLADADGARWVSHPTIGRGTPEGPCYGAIADLVFRDGPVTLLRVSREAGALFTMTATVAGRDPSGFIGCRGWIRDFRIAGEPASLEDLVATVMAHGLEHHFVLVPGNHAAVLAEVGAWTGMTPLTRRPMRDHLDATDFS
jgi:hypothetical protein